ncbi:MAG: PQQ-dependent sugar dehydrogenase [Actinomycetota bacterium]|nr:PQQ-dependent sugar dehydrogenase [Actinomycetota bacterium]
MTALLRLLCVCTLLLAACGDDDASPTTSGSTTIALPGGLVGLEADTVARGLNNPVFLTAPPGDERLFVLAKDGFIWIVTEDGVVEEPFLDIEALVGSDALEQGLLGMAFHPDYSHNGRFFIYYTNVDGDTRLAEYRVSEDPDRADSGSARVVLSADQPGTAHNGGMLLFGPDGYLYVTLGDGGGAGDEFGNAQDRATLLGSILRIDIDNGDPYAIPADNPFVDDAGAAPEVWVYGLRNPWRIAIDTEAGFMYIADVGQDATEEISVVQWDAAAGMNFGWPVMEGFDCYRAEACDGGAMTLPVLAYPHSEGCSVIGGYVYRGDAIPEMRGHYFYGDWCGGWVRSFRFDGAGAIDERDWTLEFGQIGQVQSFGLGGDGEMYVLTQDGFVLKIVPIR